MGPYVYVLKQILTDGSVWRSEAHQAETLREVRQAVIAGYLDGQPRWAETAPGSVNPYFFLYGVDRAGKAHETGTASPDFNDD